MRLTRDFTLAHLTQEPSPSKITKQKLYLVCRLGLQNLYDYLKRPVTVVKGYTTHSPHTQYYYGEAADVAVVSEKDRHTIDQEGMEKAFLFFKHYIPHTVGRCVLYKNPFGEALLLHYSIPAPGVYNDIREKEIKHGQEENQSS